MKKYTKIKSIALLLVLLVYTTSCTKDFDKINTNPNVLNENQLDATLAGPSFASALYAGIHNGSYSSPGVDDQGTWGIATGILSATFVQYLNNTQYATVRNGFGTFPSRGWLRFYSVAVPALQISFKASKDYKNETAILKIWKVFMYNQMTDCYGPIPYTEAGSGANKVAYDTQESIYEDFFKLLDEADEVLSKTSDSKADLFTGSDRVFEGDIQKWRIFGNSLRLRLALRISDVQPTKAKTQAELAVSKGVMEDNDHCATFKASATTPNNLNMIVNTWGYPMTAGIESILTGYKDPRISIWFAKTSKKDTVFRGLPAGQLGTNEFGVEFSKFNDTIMGNYQNESQKKPIEILMASECYLNRAEAALNGWNMNGTAKDFYEKGIKLSLEQWKITDASAINNYIAGTTTPIAPQITKITTFDANVAADVAKLKTPPVSVPVAWSSSEANQRTQIAVQKYLALFPESWEAWSDLRRTDQKITYDLLHTDNYDAGVGTSLMKRVIYTVDEISANGDAVKDAITKLGGPDSGGTKLWWDIK